MIASQENNVTSSMHEEAAPRRRVAPVVVYLADIQRQYPRDSEMYELALTARDRVVVRTVDTQFYIDDPKTCTATDLGRLLQTFDPALDEVEYGHVHPDVVAMIDMMYARVTNEPLAKVRRMQTPQDARQKVSLFVDPMSRSHKGDGKEWTLADVFERFMEHKAVEDQDPIDGLPSSKEGENTVANTVTGFEKRISSFADIAVNKWLIPQLVQEAALYLHRGEDGVIKDELVRVRTKLNHVSANAKKDRFIHTMRLPGEGHSVDRIEDAKDAERLLVMYVVRYQHISKNMTFPQLLQAVERVIEPEKFDALFGRIGRDTLSQ